MNRIVLIAVVFLSGCTTALWHPDYKQERVNGFYVNQDTGHFFATTADTAYIFPIDDAFGEALLLSRQLDFQPQFRDFRLDKENQVTGMVSLRLIGQPHSDEVAEQLKALGFEKEGVVRSFTLTREITGRRYTIEGELPLEKLEKELVVPVAQPRNFAQTAGKVIATPVTVAWDAVVTVPLVFVMVTVMAAGSP